MSIACYSNFSCSYWPLRDAFLMRFQLISLSHFHPFLHFLHPLSSFRALALNAGSVMTALMFDLPVADMLTLQRKTRTRREKKAVVFTLYLVVCLLLFCSVWIRRASLQMCFYFLYFSFIYHENREQTFCFEKNTAYKKVCWSPLKAKWVDEQVD